MNKNDWFEAIINVDINKATIMIDQGFDINTVDAFAKENALHKLKQAYKFNQGKIINPQENIINLVHYLIKKGIDIERKNIFGETPLESVMKCSIKGLVGDTTLIECLINQGAKTSIGKYKGFVLMDYFLAFGHTKLVKKLIEIGHDINETNEGGFTYAEKSVIFHKPTHRKAIMKTLLEFKPLLNKKQKEIIENEKLRLLFIK